MKTCTKCKKKLPTTTEYFGLDKQHKDGLTSRCKKCLSEYYQQHRKERLEYSKQHRRERLKYNKQYYQQNKEKLLKNKKQYYQQHYKKQLKYGKQHRHTIIGHLKQTFYDMKRRCNNPKRLQYKDYGGRGIQNKFKSFNEFANYVINKLQVDPRGLTIDRINNDGHYEKGNIRFVMQAENNKNRKNIIKKQ